MTEKIYLETFEKCPGSVYFPLLTIIRTSLEVVSVYSHFSFLRLFRKLLPVRFFYFQKYQEATIAGIILNFTGVFWVSSCERFLY